MEKPRNKLGRPCLYTPELAYDICSRIATTALSMKKLCDKYPHFPNPDTIYEWLKNMPNFSEQYANAKRCQADIFANEIIDLAYDNSEDHSFSPDGKKLDHPVNVQRNRLQIDTLKWLASKMIPKVYGERVQQELTLNEKEPITDLRNEMHACNQK